VFHYCSVIIYHWPLRYAPRRQHAIISSVLEADGSSLPLHSAGHRVSEICSSTKLPIFRGNRFMYPLIEVDPFKAVPKIITMHFLYHSTQNTLELSPSFSIHASTLVAVFRCTRAGVWPWCCYESKVLNESPSIRWTLDTTEYVVHIGR
jgi:hypothetical protein